MCKACNNDKDKNKTTKRKSTQSIFFYGLWALNDQYMDSEHCYIPENACVWPFITLRSLFLESTESCRWTTKSGSLWLLQDRSLVWRTCSASFYVFQYAYEKLEHQWGFLGFRSDSVFAELTSFSHHEIFIYTLLRKLIYKEHCKL